MTTRIERPELKRLIDDGDQIVEVLPREEYDYEHVAGAINIPLRELEERAPRELARDKAVVVYCNDYL